MTRASIAATYSFIDRTNLPARKIGIDRDGINYLVVLFSRQSTIVTLWCCGVYGHPDRNRNILNAKKAKPANGFAALRRHVSAARWLSRVLPAELALSGIARR
jgi:hypothetical protein